MTDGELLELTVDECWELVTSKAVGRFAANRHGLGPLVVPVNYAVDDDRTLVFRTGAGAKLEAVGYGIAVIQVDEVDPVRHTGWSVMVSGTTRWLYEEQDDTTVEPWAPGPHPYIVRLTPVQITGRRIDLVRADTDGRGYR